MFRTTRVLAAWLLAVTMATPAVAQAPKKYALLVAVTTYEHAHLNSPPKILYPEADALAIGAELKASGYEVDSLLGVKATKSAIDRALAQLTRKGNEPGVIVLGFFGHGVEYDEDGADGKPTSRSYFCPYDCTMRKRLDAKGRETFIAAGKPRIEPDSTTLISMGAVFDALALSPAGNRVLLADCCRNDPHAARGRGFGTGIKSGDLPESANTAALLACSKGERAFEDPTSKHGAFTKCVLDWLKTPQDRSTASRLGEHLDEAVPKLVADLSNGEQFQQPRFLNIGRVNLQLASIAPVKPLPQPSPPSTPKPKEPSRPDPQPSVTGKEFTSKSTGMKLALIPAGTFTMGSPVGEAERSTNEGPHSVPISQPFYMGIYEVTQGEYESVMGTNPSSFSKSGTSSGSVSGMNTSKFPVENVSWDDAVEFCKKLSAKDGVTYRLPTEAEWEYAARAGTTTPFHFGGTLNGDNANVNGNYPYGTTSKGPYLQRTTTVGSYAKNAFGLFDMHGNVWEWCEDVYDDKAYAKRSGTTTVPKVASGSEDRVLRGGSWNFRSRYTRSAYRDWNSPDYRRNYFGFRVVLSASAVRTP